MVLTTRKLKTALPSSKSKVERELQSGVIYKLSCSGWNASYVGETTRHIKTRITEHKRPNSPLGRHLAECNTGAQLEGPEILDRCGFERKLKISKD